MNEKSEYTKQPDGISFMKRFLYFFIFLLLVDIPNISCGQEEISLWNGKMPGAVENDSVEEQRFHNGEEWLIKNVTHPTLTIFEAPPENHSGTAVIICPGGGYSVLAIEKEGYEIAKWLNSYGVSAFVLKNRLPDERIMDNKSFGSLMDIQQAIKIVRQNAQQWNLDVKQIGVVGFSAGGHLASTAATQFDHDITESEISVSCRPDFGIYIYPVISFGEEYGHNWSRKQLIGENASEEMVKLFSNELNVNRHTPPAFIIHAGDDPVNYNNSLAFFNALKSCGVEASLHIFSKGGHGYGLAEGMGEISKWPDLCINWMCEMGYVSKKLCDTSEAAEAKFR